MGTIAVRSTDTAFLVRLIDWLATETVNPGSTTLQSLDGEVDVIELQAEVERLTQENSDLLDQLRQQTKSFCTHCGKLFPKGKVGMEQFRAHIAECNSHPLHPLAKEVERLKAVLRDIARGDPFHEHPGDAELRPCDIVMDYAAYRFSAKQALESKGPTP
jgi:hypothetical protein